MSLVDFYLTHFNKFGKLYVIRVNETPLGKATPFDVRISQPIPPITHLHQVIIVNALPVL